MKNLAVLILLMLSAVSFSAETSIGTFRDTDNFNTSGGTGISFFIHNNTIGDNADGYLSFNLSSIHDKVIDTARFDAVLDTSTGATLVWDIQWFSNDNWDEGSAPTGSEGSIIDIADLRKTVNGATNETANLTLNPTVIYDWYTQNITSLKTDLTALGVGGGQTLMRSRELADPIPTIVFNLVDQKTATILATDNPVFYFDFESGTASTSFFNEADIKLDPANNEITPLREGAFFSTESDISNTLLSVTCREASGTYQNASQFVGINSPSGTFDTFCFNLTQEHVSGEWYGAIKVIENSNVRSGLGNEYDFHYAIYSPSFTTFSQAVFSPDPPSSVIQLNITYTSSNPVTSGFRFRKVVGNTTFPYNAVINNSAFKTSHSLSALSGLEASTFYQYQLFGVDASANNFSSSTFNFTTASVSAPTPTPTPTPVPTPIPDVPNGTLAEIVSVSVSEASPTLDEDVSITVRVRNTGNSSHNFSVGLSIGNVSGSGVFCDVDCYNDGGSAYGHTGLITPTSTVDVVRIVKIKNEFFSVGDSIDILTAVYPADFLPISSAHDSQLDSSAIAVVPLSDRIQAFAISGDSNRGNVRSDDIVRVRSFIRNNRTLTGFVNVSVGFSLGRWTAVDGQVYNVTQPIEQPPCNSSCFTGSVTGDFVSLIIPDNSTNSLSRSFIIPQYFALGGIDLAVGVYSRPPAENGQLISVVYFKNITNKLEDFEPVDLPNIKDGTANAFGQLLGVESDVALAFISVLFAVIVGTVIGRGVGSSIVSLVSIIAIASVLSFMGFIPIFLLVLLSVIVALLVVRLMRENVAGV